MYYEYAEQAKGLQGKSVQISDTRGGVEKNLRLFKCLESVRRPAYLTLHNYLGWIRLLNSCKSAALAYPTTP